MHNFKRLDIWIKAKDLVKEIYLLSANLPLNEQYGLKSQIQRAAVSIPANIAEGSAKTSEKDFARFLEIALGSAFELETLIILLCELGFANTDLQNDISIKIQEIQRMIYAFKNKLMK